MKPFNLGEWEDDVMVEVEKITNFDHFRWLDLVCGVKTASETKGFRRWYVTLDGRSEIEAFVPPGTKVMRLKKKVDQEAKKGRGIFRRFLPI